MREAGVTSSNTSNLGKPDSHQRISGDIGETKRSETKTEKSPIRITLGGRGGYFLNSGSGCGISLGYTRMTTVRVRVEDIQDTQVGKDILARILEKGSVPEPVIPVRKKRRLNKWRYNRVLYSQTKAGKVWRRHMSGKIYL